MKAKHRASGRARGGICKLKKTKDGENGEWIVDSALRMAKEAATLATALESGADFVVIKIDMNIESGHFSRGLDAATRTIDPDVSLAFDSRQRYWLGC
jgi:hypothetical protein